MRLSRLVLVILAACGLGLAAPSAAGAGPGNAHVNQITPGPPCFLNQGFQPAPVGNVSYDVVYNTLAGNKSVTANVRMHSLPSGADFTIITLGVGSNVSCGGEINTHVVSSLHGRSDQSGNLVASASSSFAPTDHTAEVYIFPASEDFATAAFAGDGYSSGINTNIP